MFRGCTSGYARIKAWEAKMRLYVGTGIAPDYTAPVVQHKYAEMHRKAALAFNEQGTYQNQVSSLLGSSSVSSIVRSGYQAFSGQVYGLQVRMSGNALAMEVAVILAKWVARGLEQAVLEAIRDDVFGIPAPVGP